MNSSYNIDIDRPFLMNGDCAEQMRRLPDASIDAIVTDPPYGLAFMGAKWDNFGNKSCGNDSAEVRRQNAEEYAAKNSGAPRYANGHGGAPTLDAMRSFQSTMTPIFAEALRVAKPGAYLLAFGGTRTYHRLACAIEDAGWEVRDCIMWLYGSGFPKSMDISKAIDKKLGAEREKVQGVYGKTSFGLINDDSWTSHKTTDSNIPVSDEAKKWNGWGTCLKPAYEPIIMARKPVEGTIVDNVLKHGTGGINIDECRVPYESEADKDSARPQGRATAKVGALAGGVENDRERTEFTVKQTNGRFPANFLHDGSDEVVEVFPDGTGAKASVKAGIKQNSMFSTNGTTLAYEKREETSTNASRFFYCAKVSRSERGEENMHPTVKPLALMRYLVRLVTRKGGVVLDPFMGSGTTGVAAVQEGMCFVGIEKDVHYYEIAIDRIYSAKPEPPKPIQEELPLCEGGMT